MAPMAPALILGWWLVAASRAQLLPPPSLSLHSSHGVSLGDTVTLRCHLPQPAARVQLYKEGYSGFRKQAHMHMVQDMAEFPLVSVKKEDAVKYQCQYWVLEPPGISEKSEPVELVVTDPSYPPASISLIPKERVETGTNVTIQCGDKYHGGTIFLHKDGHSAPLQQQKPNDHGTATFILFGVTPADSGTYRCSYRVGGFYRLSSCLGDNVTLEVIARSARSGDNRGPSLNLVAAVAGSCAAVIVIILILMVSFLLAAQRRQIQREEYHGATRSPEAMRFQVSPDDSQALTYAELQALTPSTHPPGSSTTPEPPIIYAEVGTGGPR